MMSPRVTGFLDGEPLPFTMPKVPACSRDAYIRRHCPKPALTPSFTAALSSRYPHVQHEHPLLHGGEKDEVCSRCM